MTPPAPRLVDGRKHHQKWLDAARRIVAVGVLRRQLGLTQGEFARRYRLAVGTVRDRRQGRSVPDAPARALLRAIDGEPEVLARVLWA